MKKVSAFSNGSLFQVWPLGADSPVTLKAKDVVHFKHPGDLTEVATLELKDGSTMELQPIPWD